MTAHKHAHLMAQYAQDAMETETPWTRWEMRGGTSAKWYTPAREICFDSSCDYRRKPKTMTYTITIPEPMREAPPLDTEYYIVSLFEPNNFDIAYWGGFHAEHMLLKRGLCFKTEEDAIAAAKAMLPFKTEGV